MIYIGLDLGEVSLGIARSDTGVIANGVETYRFPKVIIDKPPTIFLNI